MSLDSFEAVIGLEIHAQLLTQSKLFCSCPTTFASLENANICPICVGLPGALPAVNKRAVELAVRTGLALNCEINTTSQFARKNYFYPDLPKGYQISQYELPICGRGVVRFFANDQLCEVEIVRAHLEEDAGKSTHAGGSTLVNYNRASVPLLEIVSAPQIRTAVEAAEYARAVHSILIYAEVCDGNLEEGSMRCDCNVSVRKRGEQKLGTKVELKNINSFRFIEKAIEFEIQRQIGLVEAGQKIVQETRLYDSDKNKTYSMRTKEEAQDYRYFPDPDLPAIVLDSTWVSEIRKAIPELPFEMAKRFEEKLGLPKYDASVLVSSKKLAQFFEVVANICGNPKLASNWVMVELLGKLNDAKIGVENSPVSPQSLGALLRLVENQKISGKIAKNVFAEMFETGSDPEAIILTKGLSVVSDSESIEKWIGDVIEGNPNQVAQYQSGKEKAFGFFVGQVMKKSGGKASPEIVNRLLRERLTKK